jgi:ABC-type antimicrobial peptide transport system permease subunit
VRQALFEVDPDVPVTGLARLETTVAESAGTRRFVALLLSAFGGLALVLGAVGVFGVTAYTVARRVPELGLRKALGATPAGLVGETLGRGLRPVVAGVAVGVLVAALASRLLASLLYEVEPRDPATLAAVAAFLLAVAAAAIAFPAVKASKVDPMRVLREE